MVPFMRTITIKPNSWTGQINCQLRRRIGQAVDMRETITTFKQSWTGKRQMAVAGGTVNKLLIYYNEIKFINFAGDRKLSTL